VQKRNFITQSMVKRRKGITLIKERWLEENLEKI
jgi:hypothetical protein